MSRQKILQTAAAELGITEHPPRSNRNKYGKWYGWDGYAWCAMFVSWVYDQAGHPLGFIEDAKGYRSCQGGYRFWKAKGKLTAKPKPGDIVLYDWNGDGHCEHTGIFAEWVKQGSTFKAYEGNTAIGNDSDGGKVMLRTRNAGSVKAFVGLLPDNSKGPEAAGTLRRGDTGSAVAALQKMLRDLRYDIIVDGSFGPGTERAVKQFQKDKGQPQDGIAGPVLLGLLEDALQPPEVPESLLIQGSFLHRGATGAAVVTLQKALNRKMGTGTVVADGIFGKATFDALKKFQRQQGLVVDGVAGPQTFAALGIKQI